MATAASKKALEKVRTALDAAVAGLPDDDYREVLEDLDCDIEGRLEALKEEHAEED
jgi:hypothetical protein